jgi:glyoxylase-like metal-dependent hydrolase (beta-lactamase superfamily II)
MPTTMPAVFVHGVPDTSRVWQAVVARLARPDVVTRGARTVEIHHMAGNSHADGLLLVCFPAARLLIQADAFTPGPPSAPTPAIVNPLSVNLADSITRLALSVDRLLPLHGRMVPLADLQRAIGRANRGAG